LTLYVDEIVSKGQLFILDSGGRIKTSDSYTHVGTEAGLTNLESIRSEISKKQIDSDSQCSEYSASIYEIKIIKISGLQQKL
jgi:hypothetical protein